MTPTEPHDFEVIASPEAENDATTANAPHDEADTGDKNVRELFDKANKPLIVQRLAKFVILSSIPFLMAWTVLSAFIASAYQPNRKDDTTPEEAVLQQVHDHIQDGLDQYRRCLTWVDETMPQVLEK